MSLITDNLLQSLDTLLASGREIPATDLRAFQAQMIAAIAVLEARARGNRIHTTSGVPGDALGMEGDLGVNKLTGDYYSFVNGKFVFLFNGVGKAGVFKPIPANAVGIHPAFSNQDELNVYLLQHQGGGGTVTPPVNVLPVATAGADTTIQLPANAVSLVGSGTDADGTIGGYLWTQLTGPGTATLATPTAATTTASGLVAGSYKFRLRVTDNQGGIATDDVVVTVNAQTAPGYSQPAPTELVVNDTNNRLSFKRRYGQPGTAYRFRVQGGAWQMLPDLRSPNEYSNFLIGNRDYAAGAVEIAEFFGATQLSPAAATTQPFTHADFLPTALAYAGDSVCDESGSITDANPNVAEKMLPSRLGALLNQGVDTEYQCTGGQGMTIDQMLSDNNIVNETYSTRFSGRNNAKMAYFEFINQAVKVGTPIDGILEKNYLFADKIRAANPSLFSKFLLVGPTDQVEPLKMDDGETPMPYTWSALKARVYQQVPLTMAGRVDTFISLENCPYIGVDGAALLGLKNGTYRDKRHPGSGTDGKGGGRLVLASRIAAAVLAEDGIQVADDFTSSVMPVVNGNTVFWSHSSKWAVEGSIDGGATWSITPIFYADNIVNGSLLVRNVAAPYIVVAVAYTVATGYEAETIQHARTVYAPLTNYATNLKQAVYDPAVSHLKTIGRLADLAFGVNGGTGVLGGLRPNTWLSLAGPHALAYAGADAPNGLANPTYDPNSLGGLGAMAFNVAGRYCSFDVPLNLAGEYTIVLRIDYPQTGFCGLLGFNRTALALTANGENVWISTDVERGNNVPLLAGVRDLLVRVTPTTATLRVGGGGTDTRTLTSALASLNQLTLGANVNADNTRGNGSNAGFLACYILQGAWTDAEVDAFRASI